MLLGDYFQNINKNFKNIFFSGISFDTRNIKKNYIFFAIKGNNTDGNKFIRIAIKKGYANELSKSRTVTLALLIGIIIGYILGNIIPLE